MNGLFRTTKNKSKTVVFTPKPAKISRKQKFGNRYNTRKILVSTVNEFVESCKTTGTLAPSIGW